MEISNQEYSRLVQAHVKASPLWKDLTWAFGVGGAICALGQALRNFYQRLGLDLDQAGTAVSITLVFIAALLTGLGLYEPIVEFGGAGATVPLLGFGYSMAEGVKEAVAEQGFLGIFTGGLQATAGGIAAAVFFSFLGALNLRRMLDRIEQMKTDLAVMQRRLDAMVAFSDPRRDLEEKILQTREKMRVLVESRKKLHIRRILGNPTMVSRRYRHALEDVRQFIRESRKK